MEKLLTSRKGDMMKMKRVSDEWISSAIGNGLARSSEKIVMALVELQERRAAEKKTIGQTIKTPQTGRRSVRKACWKL